MKCKNCGAELTMLEKFCPNCGTPNEQSQQHIKDMEHYEHEFSDTQKEVVRNSKWFIKYIAPVTSLVIAGIAAVIVTIQANHLWGYNLAEQKQKKYNQTHEQEIKEHLQTLLDNGQYEEVYQLYTRLNQRMSGTGNSGWYDFYNMTEGYLRLRNAIMFYYNPELSEHYSKETALNNAAEAICMITGSAQGKSYRERAAESIPYMEDIKEKAGLFLKDYCNFTQADIDSLENRDRTSVINFNGYGGDNNQAENLVYINDQLFQLEKRDEKLYIKTYGNTQKGSVKLKKGMQVTTQAAHDVNADILVIQMGSNGGWDSYDELQAPSLFLPVFFIIIVVTVIFTVILACVL